MRDGEGMAKIREALSKVVGAIQCIFGVSMSILAYLVYPSPQVQDLFGITFAEVYLYMLLLLVLGVFSIISGLLLVKEKEL